MDKQSSNTTPTANDMRTQTFRLFMVFDEYRKLLELYISPKDKDKQVYRYLDLLHTGIDCRSLFSGKRTFTLSMPASFEIEPVSVTIPDHSSGHYPSNLKLPLDDVSFVAVPKGREGYGTNADWLIGRGHYTAITVSDPLFLLSGAKLPKGFVLQDCLQIKPNAAGIWLEYISIILGYYFAGVELLVSHRYICPTLEGMGMNLYSLLEMIREGKREHFLEIYSEVCREFKIMLAELQRAWLRLFDSKSKKKISVTVPVRSTHESGFLNPSIPYLAGEAARGIGMKGAGVSGKLKNRINVSKKEDPPERQMAKLTGKKKRSYWFNRDYAEEFRKLEPIYSHLK